ncbi:MAG: argininosuccinate lyase, partial [Polyangiaceae bacterium]
MSRPLWDKGNASDEQMMRYTARDDFVLDQRLLRYDLKATTAHVRGLQRIGVLTLEEVAAMENALETLDQRCKDGQFQL